MGVSDRDAEIRRLNIKVRELEEELAEWRRHGAERLTEDDLLDRILDTMRLRPQSSLLLAWMMRRPGRLLTNAAIAAVVVKRDVSDGLPIAKVSICYIRRAIAPIEGAEIVTVFGLGYRMPQHSVAAILDFLGLAAA